MKSTRSWLEMLSALAVVVGLFFVAMELRLNSEALRAQTRAEISNAYTQLIAMHTADDSFIHADLKLESGEELSSFERMKIDYSVNAHFRLAENSFYQYREGNYSEEEFEAERRFWRVYLSNSIRRSMWDKYKYGFSEDFQNQMDDLLETD